MNKVKDISTAEIDELLIKEAKIKYAQAQVNLKKAELRVLRLENLISFLKDATDEEIEPLIGIVTSHINQKNKLNEPNPNI